jgi:hypothetical protein
MSITERIQQSTDALGAISVLTEQKFSAIGDRVERAVTILDHLTVTFEALLAEIQSDAVVQAKQDLALAASEAASLADAPASEAAALDRLAHTTDAINARITAMRNIARDVDMLAINARLIAAGMGEAGFDFLGFATEIRRSAKLALSRLEQIGRELTNAKRQLMAARNGVMAYAEHHGASLRAIPERLTAAVHTLQAHDRLAVAAATAVAARTADVQRQVAGIIVALQLGDITRQRVEHMQEVARTLLPFASPASVARSEWRALPPDVIAAMLHAGCTLAAAQLRDTADELDTEAGRVAFSLGRLAENAQDISRLGLEAYGAANRHHRGFMAELEANLRETEALFEGQRAARDDTERRIVSVLAIAHGLSENIDTLQGLEADIRIMGLNTTLKCGRLGVLGRPLSVIAQELRDHGSRTASHADAALADLSLLTNLAGAFSTTRKELAGTAAGNLSHDLFGAADLLGRTGLVLSEALVRLDDESGAASQLLQEAARDFSVRHDLGEVLHGTAEALSGIAGQQADPTMTATAAIDRLLAQFAQTYTMARERQLHARCGGSQVQEPKAATEPDMADLLF